MDIHENMNGSYWRTCSKDITSSPGWFRRLMLLGLVGLVPVFGQMTVQGYAYEWAHKAAWGVDSRMPGKIYGRANSKMLRWGWFAVVITFVFLLVPNILSRLSSACTSAATATSAFWQHSAGMPASSVFLVILGALLTLVALAALVFCALFGEVGTMRMVVYDRLAAGFQLKKIWAMVKHDAGGLLRVVGMGVLCALVVAIVWFAVFAIVLIPVLVMVMLGAVGGGMLSAAGSGMNGLAGFVVGLLASGFVIVVPVLAWLLSTGMAWVNILMARGMGYWTAQFDVASWGTKDDPLPFERTYGSAACSSTAEAPGQPEAQHDAPDAAEQSETTADGPAAGEPEAQPVADAPDSQSPGPAASAASAGDDIPTAQTAPEDEPLSVAADDIAADGDAAGADDEAADDAATPQRRPPESDDAAQAAQPDGSAAADAAGEAGETA